MKPLCGSGKLRDKTVNIPRVVLLMIVQDRKQGSVQCRQN